jgi:hypothetical protein
MRYKHIKTLAVTAAVALAACTSAHAQLTFTITEQPGGGVKTSFSGSLHFSPADVHNEPSAYGGNLEPKVGGLQVGPTIPGHIELNGIMTGPSAFGTGDINLPDGPDSGSTAGFNASANAVFLPTGYTPGTFISGSVDWLTDFNTGDPATLANLGCTPGHYVWNTLSHGIADTITLNIIPVPEPHEYALMAGLGLIGFAGFRRWRQRA